MTTEEDHTEMIAALTTIGRLTDACSDMTQDLHSAVGYARSQGASWRLIGAALGTSTQAAWERFRQPDPPRSTAHFQDVLTGTLRLWEEHEPKD